ncbi:MAG: zinc ribbon domain-containing protein [Candidatus Aminicenantes bacterium]|nr:zinc ribbon domain-containing protein [Candidatus Aminicenantes bacterium]
MRRSTTNFGILKGGKMLCSKCYEELSEGANFCSTCGLDVRKDKPIELKRTDKRLKVNSEVEYGGYLAVGGWLMIIAGAIVALILLSKANSGFGFIDNKIILIGGVVVISAVTYAWLYFGLHKAILKITRIEQVLGIAEYQEFGTKGVDTMKENASKIDGNVKKGIVNDS